MTQHPRRRPGRPASDDRVATREQILEKALDAFALHGFEATSLRALSHELGGSHGLVHHHFGSKDALWQAAIDHVLGRVRARTEQLADLSRSENITESYLRRTLVDVIKITISYPMMARIALDEGARGGPRLDYLYQNYFEPMNQIWRGALTRVGKQKVTDFVDEGRMLFFMVAMGGSAPFFAPALADKFDGPSMEGDKAIERYAQSMADLVFDGLNLDTD
ncbi:MAG: TetR/AcrR family transcriptional regulator [Pseudomonadota bacterium]